MNFIKESGDEHSFYRHVSTDGKFEVFVYPVMYGFRVRASFVKHNYWANLDYCAGDKIEAVQEIFSLVIRILMNYQTFDVFPIQLTKPMDPECAKKLFNLAEGTKPIKIEFPELNKMKQEYLKAIWK